ncbi:hypothetical protein V6Z12_A07G158500 [Gossypium hirsutum]
MYIYQALPQYYRLPSNREEKIQAKNPAFYLDIWRNVLTQLLRKNHSWPKKEFHRTNGKIKMNDTYNQNFQLTSIDLIQPGKEADNHLISMKQMN